MINRKSAIVMASVLVLATVLMTQVQQVKAGAVEDGQSEAENDFINSAGQDPDPDCNAENGVNYCTLYKTGYNTRWAHMNSVYDCSSGVCK